jgi:hypothetical protein
MERTEELRIQNSWGVLGGLSKVLSSVHSPEGEI